MNSLSELTILIIAYFLKGHLACLGLGLSSIGQCLLRLCSSRLHTLSCLDASMGQRVVIRGSFGRFHRHLRCSRAPSIVGAHRLRMFKYRIHACIMILLENEHFFQRKLISFLYIPMHGGQHVLHRSTVLLLLLRWYNCALICKPIALLTFKILIGRRLA